LDDEWGTYYPEDYPILLDAVGIARNMTVTTAVQALTNFPSMKAMISKSIGIDWSHQIDQIAAAREEIAKLTPQTLVSETCAAWLAMA